MNSDKMTVGTALQIHKDLQDTLTMLSAISTAVQTDPKLHDLLQSKSAEYMPDKKPREPSYTLSGAINHIKEYSKLLKKSIDSVEMPWPPA